MKDNSTVLTHYFSFFIIRIQRQTMLSKSNHFSNINQRKNVYSSCRPTAIEIQNTINRTSRLLSPVFRVKDKNLRLLTFKTDSIDLRLFSSQTCCERPPFSLSTSLNTLTCVFSPSNLMRKTIAWRSARLL